MDASGNDSKLDTPNDVLLFWFGTLIIDELSDVNYIKRNMSRWFAGSDPSFDQVQKDNRNLVEYVANSNFDDVIWETPCGYLARILLLDQFTRCIYRGTTDAFKYDQLTSQLVKRIVDNNWLLSEYVPIYRFFLGVAIQHSEELCMQKIGLDIAHLVAQGCENDIDEFFKGLKGYPNEHHDVIEQFHRFPSRNDVLGRVSTVAEMEWMESPECPVWAKSQLKRK